MKIGFIGAGKVGCSLGKYFALQGAEVTGYYSRSLSSAKTAAEFVGTNYYESLETVVRESDCLFFTVNDTAISEVWDMVKNMNVKDKIICHCSGAKSASEFSGADERKAYGFSLHPISPISSRYDSYKNIVEAFFTLEGNKEKLPKMEAFLKDMHLRYTVISGHDKMKYHGACVFASNLMVALAYDATKLLEETGFSSKDAKKAIAPLMLQNMEAVATKGPMEALTGPVERADVETVAGHLSVLSGNQKEIYRNLSQELIAIAKEKHKEKDYGNMEALLSEKEK